MGLSGLAQLNIETTARCDKATLCGFCAHQADPAAPRGDMDFALLERIRAQLDPGTLTIQYHRDGDPLAYPRLRDSLDLFEGFVRSIVTHGETLAARAAELIGRCEAVTVSVFRGDADAERQWGSLTAFLQEKGDRLPRVLIKIVGDLDPGRYVALGVPILRRRLHDPMNTRYGKALPALPEQGVCLDFLSKPAIAWTGKMYQCVRFDETEAGYLGDVNTESLEALWNGARRRAWLTAHLAGRRDLANPRCAACTYYGIPVSV